MKKRGVLTLLLAAALVVTPPVLEAAGLDLSAMTVTASSNNSSSAGSASGNNTSTGNSASGNNTSTGSASGNNTSTGKPGTPGTAGEPGTPGEPGTSGTPGEPGTPGNAGAPGNAGTTNRPTASGNNTSTGNNGSNGSSNASGTQITSTITVNNATGHAAGVASSLEAIARAAGLRDGESLVATVTGDYTAADEQLIKNAAAAAGAQVAYIVDIKLNIEGREGNPQVTSLNSAIRFTVAAPDGIDGNVYDFAVVRIHNGRSTLLADRDSNPATITFESDRFSPYAVVYAPKGQLKGVKDSVPKTGDVIPAAIPAAATTCLAAAAVTAVALNKRKRV